MCPKWGLTGFQSWLWACKEVYAIMCHYSWERLLVHLILKPKCKHNSIKITEMCRTIKLALARRLKWSAQCVSIIPLFLDYKHKSWKSNCPSFTSLWLPANEKDLDIRLDDDNLMLLKWVIFWKKATELRKRIFFPFWIRRRLIPLWIVLIWRCSPIDTVTGKDCIAPSPHCSWIV